MRQNSVQKRIPITGEVWRAKDGCIREVTFVSADDLCDGGKWAHVGYMRPKQAYNAYATVSLRQWWNWVDKHQSVCAQKTWRSAS